jgi:tetratricopeptide (TPR) repeat protein
MSALRLGKYSDTILMGQKSLEINERISLRDRGGYLDELIVKCYYMIGEAYEHLADCDKAIHYYKTALSTIMTLFEMDHTKNTASIPSLLGLARIHCSRKSYKLTKKYSETVLSICKLNDCEVSAHAALAWCYQGEYYRYTKNYTDCHFAESKALQIREAIYADMLHVDVAESISRVAQVRVKLGELNLDTIQLYLRSFQIYSQCHAQCHTCPKDTQACCAEILASISNIYFKSGDFELAENYRREEIAYRKLHENSVSVTSRLYSAYWGLAEIISVVGDPNEASRYRVKALELLSIRFGKDHSKYKQYSSEHEQIEEDLNARAVAVFCEVP